MKDMDETINALFPGPQKNTSENWASGMKELWQTMAFHVYIPTSLPYLNSMQQLGIFRQYLAVLCPSNEATTSQLSAK